MKVEVKEKHIDHRQNHELRHQKKYPNSVVYTGMRLHDCDKVVIE
jgi:hypothetical protein